MICPDNDLDCDNVGCRRGGCQGRRPNPPLLRARAVGTARGLPLLDPDSAGGVTALQAADHAVRSVPRRELVTA